MVVVLGRVEVESSAILMTTWVEIMRAEEPGGMIIVWVPSAMMEGPGIRSPMEREESL